MASIVPADHELGEPWGRGVWSVCGFFILERLAVAVDRGPARPEKWLAFLSNLGL